MNLVDLWAACAAGAAAIALGLRSEMLKPDLSAFHDSSPIVRYALALSSIVLGGRVVTLISGGSAQAAEAAVYTAQAFAAAALLWNLHRQRPSA